MLYSDEQAEEMSKEAKAIAKLLQATENILKQTKKSRKNKKKNGNDNIIHVDFSLKREFEKAQKLTLKLPQILAVYHDWAFRTHQLAQVNADKMNNKAICEMVELNYEIVNTITDVSLKTES